MWKASVVKKVIIDGLLTVGVLYDDGTKSFRENYTSRGEALDIEAITVRRIGELEQLHTIFTSIKDGEVKPKPKPTPEPSVPATPDPETEAKDEYRNKHLRLQRRKIDLDLGLITEADYNAIKDEVKALGKQIGEL